MEVRSNREHAAPIIAQDCSHCQQLMVNKNALTSDPSKAIFVSSMLYTVDFVR
jgi:hypothetical protein